ncbi:hypothetical protein T492DRAFT_995880 [Pavlovales sp. CCMP2436]|nr:hypothetical protein T492DRAFT_995880 [Pavlovales sp. CCMP2436]
MAVWAEWPTGTALGFLSTRPAAAWGVRARLALGGPSREGAAPPSACVEGAASPRSLRPSADCPTVASRTVRCGQSGG